jgi:hypothetical protein
MEGIRRATMDKVFVVGKDKIKKSELVRIFEDLVFFGVIWDEEGRSFVFNYMEQRWEAFTDYVMRRYLEDRRRVINVSIRDNRWRSIIWTIRFLAKEMHVSERWFNQGAEVVNIVEPEQVPEMEWERL